MGYQPDTRPQLWTELETLALALVLEAVSDVSAMVIQARQGLAQASLTGEVGQVQHISWYSH